MPDFVRINDTPYSWTSVSCKIGFIPFVGIQSVDFEQKRERKLVYVMRKDGAPVGMTSGKYTPPIISLKMLVESYEELTTALTAIGLGSYGDAKFPFFLQYSEPTLGAVPITIVGSGCAIIGEKDAPAEGNDELTVDVQIQTTTFLRNGKRMVSLVRSLPF